MCSKNGINCFCCSIDNFPLIYTCVKALPSYGDIDAKDDIGFYHYLRFITKLFNQRNQS